MKRIKSVDTIRGLCILLMILGHLMDWWIRLEAILSYKSKVTNIDDSNGLTMRKVKNIYLIRALLLLIVALLYNIVIAFGINDPTWIWAWNVLQTIAISLLLGWFFLNTSKTLRILVGIVLLVANQFISILLLPYDGQTNIYGLLFYILFHPLEQFTILSYFSIFLLGTVVGDSFIEVNKINDQEERKHAIKYVYLTPLLLIGIILVAFGFIFRFPDIIFRRTFSSLVFCFQYFYILKNSKLLKQKKVIGFSIITLFTLLLFIWRMILYIFYFLIN